MWLAMVNIQAGNSSFCQLGLEVFYRLNRAGQLLFNFVPPGIVVAEGIQYEWAIGFYVILNRFR